MFIKEHRTLIIETNDYDQIEEMNIEPFTKENPKQIPLNSSATGMPIGT